MVSTRCEVRERSTPGTATRPRTRERRLSRLEAQRALLVASCMKSSSEGQKGGSRQAGTFNGPLMNDQSPSSTTSHAHNHAMAGSEPNPTQAFLTGN